jgi:hypothetical protein
LALDAADPLTSLLFQVTGAAHIPWADPIWQELLHGYNVWVHVIYTATATAGDNDENSSVLSRACDLTVRFAARSSNIAAFCMHVTMQLRDFTRTATISTNKQQQEEDPVTAFSNRISLVSKARALAGALNLFRILVHQIITHASTNHSTSADASMDGSGSGLAHRRRKYTSQHHHHSTIDILREVFCYKSREHWDSERDTGPELIDALLQFLSTTHLLRDIPELYDCVTMALQCVLVLLSSQLYQPMHSSFHRYNNEQQQKLSKANSKQQQHENRQFSRSYSFWNMLMECNNDNNNNNPDKNAKDNAKKTTECSSTTTTTTTTTTRTWTPRQFLKVLLEYQIQRPAAPEKSIQYHSCTLARQVVMAKGEKVGPDGMYETHLVVDACAPTPFQNGSSSSNLAAIDSSSSSTPQNQNTPILSSSASSPFSRTMVKRQPSSKAILDATRGVLVISSQIILLPFRLMTLALGLWGLHDLQRMGGGRSYDQVYKLNIRKRNFHGKKSRTRDVLWLTDSPVADLSTTLLLLLIHNERYPDGRNPFRTELAKLVDNRWESEGDDLPDLPDLMLGGRDTGWNGHDSFNHHPQEESNTNALEMTSLLGATPEFPKKKIIQLPKNSAEPSDVLTVNFEALFEAFGQTSHTEPGALLLYTLLQTSSTFAQSIAVRSDLDTLILPLLRTLYFATSIHFHVAAQQDYSSTNGGGHRRPSSNNSRRSSSRSDVSQASGTSVLSIRDCPYRSQSQLYVIIILLLLFSQDASFGADAFRRCTVATVPWYKERYLKDISLGSILILSLLRGLAFNLNRQQDAFLLSNCCAVLMNLSPAIVDLHDYAAMRLTSLTVSILKRYLKLKMENPDNNEDDLSTPTSMYGEASRTLLCALKHCLCPKNIGKNLHLIYALVYHQADFNRIFSSKECSFTKGEISRIQTVMATCAKLIEEDGSARTAARALKILTDNVDQIQMAVADRRKRAEPEDFTFTYEEEADPEIFFVPYVWEVVVCVVTSASIEWNKNRIQVFPLLDEEPEDEMFELGETHEISIPQFARDVTDVV